MPPYPKQGAPTSITAYTAFLVSIISLTWTLFLSFRLLYWVYWKRLSWIARMGGSRHTSIFLEALRNSLQREQYPWGAGGSKEARPGGAPDEHVR